MAVGGLPSPKSTPLAAFKMPFENGRHDAKLLLENDCQMNKPNHFPVKTKSKEEPLKQETELI